MKRHYLLTCEELETRLQPHIAALQRQGINAMGLLSYSLNPAQTWDYRELESYISQEVYELNPGLMDDIQNHRTVVHTCLDFVDLASQYVVPLIESILNRPCDQRMRLETYLGQNDLMVSVTD